MEEKKERSAAAIYARAFFEKEKLSFHADLDLAAYMQQAFQNVQNGLITTLDQDLGYDAVMAIIKAIKYDGDINQAINTLIRHALTLAYERIFDQDVEKLPIDNLFWMEAEKEELEKKLEKLEAKIAQDEKSTKIAELEAKITDLYEKQHDLLQKADIAAIDLKIKEKEIKRRDSKIADLEKELARAIDDQRARKILA